MLVPQVLLLTLGCARDDTGCFSVFIHTDHLMRGAREETVAHSGELMCPRSRGGAQGHGVVPKADPSNLVLLCADWASVRWQSVTQSLPHGREPGTREPLCSVE